MIAPGLDRSNNFIVVFRGAPANYTKVSAVAMLLRAYGAEAGRAITKRGIQVVDT